MGIITVSCCQCNRPRSSPRPHFRAPKTRDSSCRALRVHLSSARATACPLARSPQSGCRRWQHSRSILQERYTKYATTPTNNSGHSTGCWAIWQRGGRNRTGLKELHPMTRPVSSPAYQDNPSSLCPGNPTPISVPASDVVCSLSYRIAPLSVFGTRLITHSAKKVAPQRPREEFTNTSSQNNPNRDNSFIRVAAILTYTSRNHAGVGKLKISNAT